MGAVWGAIPGVLKARFGSHEVINTIMLNFIAVALVSYFTQYHYKAPAIRFCKRLRSVTGRTLRDSENSFPVCQNAFRSISPSYWRCFACLLVYLFLWRTKWGYEITINGK